MVSAPADSSMLSRLDTLPATAPNDIHLRDGTPSDQSSLRRSSFFTRPHTTPLTAHGRAPTTLVGGHGGPPTLAFVRGIPSYIREAGSFLLSAFISLLVFIFVFLAFVTSLAFKYIILLGLWNLDSFSRPLAALRDAVVATTNAGLDTQAAADAAARVAWRAYCRSVAKELEVSGALSALVLTLTIGLLSITSIAEEIVTKTIAFACMFACAAGIVMSLNMRRHMGNVSQAPDASSNWVTLAGRYMDSQFATVPMLLAGPHAWATWSVLSFMALLLSYVWRLRHATVHITVMHGNSTLPMLLLVPTDASGGGDSDSSSNGVVYLPWVSRIPLIVELVVAVAHFIVNAVYFTRLGVPLPTAADVELGNAHLLAMNGAAVPGNMDNAATPGGNQAAPSHAADDAHDPMAAIAPDHSDGSTLNEADSLDETMEYPEDEDGNRVLTLPL